MDIRKNKTLATISQRDDKNNCRNGRILPSILSNEIHQNNNKFEPFSKFSKVSQISQVSQDSKVPKVQQFQNKIKDIVKGRKAHLNSIIGKSTELEFNFVDQSEDQFEQTSNFHNMKYFQKNQDSNFSIESNEQSQIETACSVKHASKKFSHYPLKNQLIQESPGLSTQHFKSTSEMPSNGFNANGLNMKMKPEFENQIKRKQSPKIKTIKQIEKEDKKFILNNLINPKRQNLIEKDKDKDIKRLQFQKNPSNFFENKPANKKKNENQIYDIYGAMKEVNFPVHDNDFNNNIIEEDINESIHSSQISQNNDTIQNLKTNLDEFINKNNSRSNDEEEEEEEEEEDEKEKNKESDIFNHKNEEINKEDDDTQSLTYSKYCLNENEHIKTEVNENGFKYKNENKNISESIDLESINESTRSKEQSLKDSLKPQKELISSECKNEKNRGDDSNQNRLMSYNNASEDYSLDLQNSSENSQEEKNKGLDSDSIKTEEIKKFNNNIHSQPNSSPIQINNFTLKNGKQDKNQLLSSEKSAKKIFFKDKNSLNPKAIFAKKEEIKENELSNESKLNPKDEKNNLQRKGPEFSKEDENMKFDRTYKEIERSNLISKIMEKQDYLDTQFLCPISHEMFNDPVIADDGHTYERKSICSWMAKSSTSPLTNKPFATKELKENYNIKTQIEDLKSQILKLTNELSITIQDNAGNH